MSRSATARKPATTPARRRPAAQRGATGRRPAARRVSGPAGGLRGAATATAAAVAPRGVSLPRPSLPRPQLVHVAQGFSLGRAAHSVLHGRGWIGLLTVLLLGIVFMQVHMLKLNAGVSRAVETAATLEKQNAQLRQDVSQLGAADRIEDTGSLLGMVMPQPGSVRYLDARGAEGDARRAVRTMTAPSTAAAAPAATAPAATAPATASAPATAAAPAVAAPAAATTPAPQQAPAGQVAPAPAATAPPPDPAAAQAAPASAQTATGGVTPGQP